VVVMATQSYREHRRGGRRGADGGDPALGSWAGPAGTALALPSLSSATRPLHPILRRLNEAAKRTVRAVQDYSLLAWNAIRFVGARPFYRADVLQQMDVIGVESLGIVLLTGFFTGMVLALQSSVQMAQFGATIYVGRLVTASMIRELGPVLAGLMVAGRVGSGIAAQLGSMRVTEQIDALETLGTDPIKKLVTPRLLAGLVMLPVLTIIADFVGILGGNAIATLYVGLPASLYWRTVWEQIAAGGFVLGYVPADFVQGLTKPFVFGGIIAITGCHFGLSTTGGTEGVGAATTRTVVTASILILVVDYFMTQLLLYVLRS
jgi:phospholipid/cholesterol/gamma-HCH transport system permease protein